MDENTTKVVNVSFCCIKTSIRYIARNSFVVFLYSQRWLGIKLLNNKNGKDKKIEEWKVVFNIVSLENCSIKERT